MPPPEEQACFGALGIQLGGVWLTEGHDTLVNTVRLRPRLSAYHLARWLAWNWWRLRWEGAATGLEDADWGQSHRLASVGGGYLWPDLRLISDGQRIRLDAKATPPQRVTPYRYLNSLSAIVPAHQFEAVVDDFLSQVLARLQAQGLYDTELHTLWQQVCAERADPAIKDWRRLEAMMGADPDEGDPLAIQQWLDDAQTVGLGGIAELAAQPGQLQVADLRRCAQSHANALDEAAGVQWTSATPLELAGAQDAEAWVWGEQLARRLRQQERLADDAVLGSDPLAEWAGTRPSLLEPVGGTPSALLAVMAAFVLPDPDAKAAQVVLRQSNSRGRRFELARLLGDRLLADEPGLRLASASSTWRQKYQRAFAAELLCPHALAMELGIHADSEAISQLADAYHVSERLVMTQRVNHGLEDRLALAA
jgi:hypothetical protein